MKYGLQYFTDTHLTAIGLLLFLGSFIGILIYNWGLVDRDRQLYIESLPLQGDQQDRVNKNESGETL
jgi:hypothetical protein